MCELAEKDVGLKSLCWPQEQSERIEQEKRIKNLLDQLNSKRRSKEILIIALTEKFFWLNGLTIPY